MSTQEPVGEAFDFGRVIQRTFQVIGANGVLFAVGALALVSLPLLVGTLIGLKWAGNPIFGLWIAVGSLLSALGSVVLQGTVVRAAVGGMNGAPVAPREAVSTGVRFLLPLIGLAIVSALGIWLGLILLIVPGVIASLMWSVAAPVLVVEKLGVFGSLKRSRDLTRGRRWAILGLFVLYMIVSFILGVVIQAVGLPLGVSSSGLFGLNDATMSVGLIVFVFASSLVNGLQGVIVAAGVASLYYELRTSKEGAAPEDTASVFD
jgi:hypothetical protein